MSRRSQLTRLTGLEIGFSESPVVPGFFVSDLGRLFLVLKNIHAGAPHRNYHVHLFRISGLFFLH
jgi:hypothetical protein